MTSYSEARLGICAPLAALRRRNSRFFALTPREVKVRQAAEGHHPRADAKFAARKRSARRRNEVPSQDAPNSRPTVQYRYELTYTTTAEVAHAKNPGSRHRFIPELRAAHAHPLLFSRDSAKSCASERRCQAATTFRSSHIACEIGGKPRWPRSSGRVRRSRRSPGRSATRATRATRRARASARFATGAPQIAGIW